MTTYLFSVTPRQFAVLRFVAEFVAGNGYCPSLSDIAKRFRFASKTGAVSHVAALRRKQLLEPNDRRGRTIRPTEAGWAWTADRGRPAGRRPSVPAGRPARHARVTVRRDGVKRKARTTNV
jgi:SOS-response transcriptional repressor LexA